MSKYFVIPGLKKPKRKNKTITSGTPQELKKMIDKQRIIEAVEKESGLTYEEILVGLKRDDIANARTVLRYFLIRHTQLTIQQVWETTMRGQPSKSGHSNTLSSYQRMQKVNSDPNLSPRDNRLKILHDRVAATLFNENSPTIKDL